ncbi:hypothetical protein [Pseudomonas savastanoi]|uniref:hypothetical protein n=1 Tax=Pseudomonas savastanoi TaxID=29438 RepID=UPI0013C29F0C|nr:hypothetical protein [Pseudomonas savastanoi]
MAYTIKQENAAMAGSDYIEIEFTKKEAVCAAVVFVIFAGLILYSTWLNGYTQATVEGTDAIASCIRLRS